MAVTYFKRYRMEIDLTAPLPPVPPLAADYHLVPWDDDLVDAHAEAKYQSFRQEMDAHVFACLGDPEGCLRLMTEIARKEGFLPGATWLVKYHPRGVPIADFCGTIQGIFDRANFGAIQNLGITPEHRGRHLGSILLKKSLDGFKGVGLKKAFLEVTAQNTGAIKLYERFGFRKVRTVYKAVEVAYA